METQHPQSKFWIRGDSPEESETIRTPREYGRTVPRVEYAGGVTEHFGAFRYKYVVQDGIRYLVDWKQTQGWKGTWLIFRINHPIAAGILWGIFLFLCILSVFGILLLVLFGGSGGRYGGSGGLGNGTNNGHYNSDTGGI